MRRIIDHIDGFIERRAFLKNTIGVMGAFATGVMIGFSREASAAQCMPGTYERFCCCLCHRPETCTYADCSDEWIWPCCDESMCQEFNCFECFDTCTENCDGLVCSNTDIKCSKTEPCGACGGPGCTKQ